MPASPFEQQVYDTLAALAIPYTLHGHPPVFTVEQARAYDAGLPGAHCKNLFLRDKKGRRCFLAIFEASAVLDLRELGARIGASGLSLASPDLLLACLGVEPGAVGPFGLLHSGAREVIVLVDSRLRTYSHAGFHPNANTATLTLAWSDFERYLAHMGNPIIWI
jgi:Ala-tRNA(Pro) deacylase